jgi:hypothetical protein
MRGRVKGECGRGKRSGGEKGREERLARIKIEWGHAAKIETGNGKDRNKNGQRDPRS